LKGKSGTNKDGWSAIESYTSGTNKGGWSAIEFYTWDFVWQPKN